MIIALEFNLMKLYIILAVVLFVCLLGCLFLLYVQFSNRLLKEAFLRPRKRPLVDRSPNEFDRSDVSGRGKNWFYSNRMEFLNVQIDSFDNTKLYGYYRPSYDKDCRNVVICLHGYNEHPNETCAYAKLVMTKIQCNVLIPHQRAHEMSGGKFCSYGLYESVDLQYWIDFCKKQAGDNCRIFILGRCMGAVTALLAAAQESFSPNVAGIIADSAYDDLDETLLYAGKRKYKVNLKFIYAWTKMNVKKRFKFDTGICNVSKSARNIKVPVLLFAGTRDYIINPENTRKIYDNLNCQKRMVLVEGAGHLESYNKAPALYEKETAAFIENCCIRLVKLGRM